MKLEDEEVAVVEYEPDHPVQWFAQATIARAVEFDCGVKIWKSCDVVVKVTFVDVDGVVFVPPTVNVPLRFNCVRSVPVP